MAKYIIKDASVTINGVDLSDQVAEVTVNTDVDDVDVSTMGTGVHEHLGGLGNDSITVKFLQNFAAAKVNATLWPLKATAVSQPEFPIVVKPASGSVSTANPSFSTQKAILLTYQPIQGAVGARSEVDVTFPSNELIAMATS